MLIFANPTKRRKATAKPATKAPKTRRKPKTAGGPKMARKKAMPAGLKRYWASRRKTTKNPGTPKRRRRVHHNPVHHVRRRRVHRNPSFTAKGILGELASMNGVLLIGSAVLAPTVTNMAVDALLPVSMNEGYTRLAAKAVFVAAGAWAIDKFAKSRHAALGFAIGGLGTVISDTINVIRARQTLPATVEPAAADEIARNPAAFDALMSGSYQSLNGYEPAPMAGYDMVPAGNPGVFESLN